MLTRTEPAIHNPNVDGLIMFPPTLSRPRAGAHAPVRIAPGSVASMALLALLGLGQLLAPSTPAAAEFGATTAPAAHACAFEATVKPALAFPAAWSAGCASPSQSASSQPEAMTPAALLTVPPRSTESTTENHVPPPDPALAGSGVSAIWLLPLGLGILVLGVLFMVTMYRHRNDDDVDEPPDQGGTPQFRHEKTHPPTKT